MNQSEIVYKRIRDLFEVAEITNRGRLPDALVLPHNDIRALMQHPRALDWLHRDPVTGRITVYGVRIEDAEHINYLAGVMAYTARRLAMLDSAMREENSDGTPVMRREPLLVTAGEMKALETLARLRRIDTRFDLARGLFLDVHRIEIGSVKDIGAQEQRMMRSRSIAVGRGRW